jgi:hypothetical protein
MMASLVKYLVRWNASNDRSLAAFRASYEGHGPERRQLIREGVEAAALAADKFYQAFGAFSHGTMCVLLLCEDEGEPEAQGGGVRPQTVLAALAAWDRGEEYTPPHPIQP